MPTEEGGNSGKLDLGTVSGRISRGLIESARLYGIADEVLRRAPVSRPFEEYLDPIQVVLWNDVSLLIDEIHAELGDFDELPKIVQAGFRAFSEWPYVKLLGKMPSYRLLLYASVNYTSKTLYHHTESKLVWLSRKRYRIIGRFLHQDDLMTLTAAKMFTGIQIYLPTLFGQREAECEASIDQEKRLLILDVELKDDPGFWSSIKRIGSSFFSKKQTWEMFEKQDQEARHLSDLHREEAARLMALVEGMSEGVLMLRGGQVLMENEACRILTGGLDERAVGDLGESVAEVLANGIGEVFLRRKGEVSIRLRLELISRRSVNGGEEALLLVSDASLPRDPQEMMLVAGEQERSRIATTMKASLSALLKESESQIIALEESESDEERAARMKTVNGLLQEVAVYSRNFSRELDVLLAECENLHEALVVILEEFALISHVEILNQIDPKFKIVGEGAIVEIAYVLQEALNNAYRHGDAQKILVSSSKEGEEAFLRVDDDGVGFSKSEKSLGLGLRSMAHRVERLGGTLVTGCSDLGGARVELLFSSGVREG